MHTIEAQWSAPERLAFGRVVVGNEAAATLTLICQGPATVQITSVASSTATVRLLSALPQRIRPGKQLTLQLAWKPDAGGILDASLLVQATGIPEQAQVQLSGEAVVPACDDGNPCTEDSIVPDTGDCQHVPREGNCSDGNACTENDTCVDGNCIGEAVGCSDGVSCTLDACDPLTGCVHQAEDSRCDQSVACHPEHCDAIADCRSSIAEDGAPCGEASCEAVDVCFSGSCQHVVLPPEAVAQCDPACQAMRPCPDGGDTCAPSERLDACDDDDPCTLDVCGAGGTCTHTPAPDGTRCGSPSCARADACVSGICQRVDLNPRPPGCELWYGVDGSDLAPWSMRVQGSASSGGIAPDLRTYARWVHTRGEHVWVSFGGGSFAVFDGTSWQTRIESDVPTNAVAELRGDELPVYAWYDYATGVLRVAWRDNTGTLQGYGSSLSTGLPVAQWPLVTRLAVDAQGNPTVLFTTTTGPQAARQFIWHFDGVSWTDLAPALLSELQDAWPYKLELSPAGTVHLLFWTGTHTPRLAYYDQGMWRGYGEVPADNLGVGADSAYGLDLAFTGNGTPMVLRYTYGTAPAVYEVVQWTGTRWQARTVPSPDPSYVVQQGKLLADSHGGPLVIWSSRDGELRPVVWQSGTWIHLAGSGAANAYFNDTPPIAAELDAQGRLVLAWQRSANYASRWDGTAWRELGPATVMRAGLLPGTPEQSARAGQLLAAGEDLWLAGVKVLWRKPSAEASMQVQVLRHRTVDGWRNLTDPMVISPADDGPYTLRPQLVGLAGSQILLSWLSLFGQSSIARWSPAGWQDLSTGLPPEGGAIPVSLGGNAAALWLEASGGVVSSTYITENLNNAWSALIQLTPQRAMGLSSDDGSLYVLSGEGDYLHVSRYTADAIEEPLPVPATPLYRPDYLPVWGDAALRGNNLYVAGFRHDESVAVLHFDGTTWADITSNLAAYPTNHDLYYFMSLAVDASGRAYLAWAASEESEIYLQYWNGSEWQELYGSASAGGISNSKAHSTCPQVVTTPSRVCVSWLEPAFQRAAQLLRCADLP